MTPVFSAFSALFSQPAKAIRATATTSLHHLESLFGPWLPPGSLAQADEGSHSRQRRWPLRLVFWTFCWQIAQAGASCREAIRQAQAWCMLNAQTAPADETSSYCQARGALPLERLDQIHRSVVDEAQRGLGRGDLWQNRRVVVADGTTVTAPDTGANQKKYPQQSVQAPGCGFPILRIVAFMCLATGMIIEWKIGPWRSSELTLLQALWAVLKAGDVLLGDRGFCTWGLLAQCLQQDIDAVFRVRGKVRRDFRRGKRLSKDERLVTWTKPAQRPRTVKRRRWHRMPDQLTLRLVRCRLELPGFRTRVVTLATTLLDRDLYPVAALSRLYRRRWTMELNLRNIKSTLEMDHLSCQTPNNLEREIRMHFLIHNLIRRLMLEAARQHHCALERISFAGSLAAARRYAEALLQARNKKQRALLWNELLRVIAVDLVPDRPGRREPRAVKRRPKPYPLLMSHRRRFRESSHQNRYYKNSPYRSPSRRSSKSTTP